MGKIFSLFTIKNEKRKIGVFQKTFISLICIIVVPTIAISIINYNILQHNLDIEVNRSNLDILKQTKTAVDNILESTEHISVQITKNIDIQQFWRKPLNISNYDDIEVIRNTINVTKTFPEDANYIKKARIYSFISNTMISSDSSFYYQISGEEIAKLNKLAQMKSDTF